jgi:hypothetical protein
MKAQIYYIVVIGIVTNETLLWLRRQGYECREICITNRVVERYYPNLSDGESVIVATVTGQEMLRDQGKRFEQLLETSNHVIKWKKAT